MDEKHWLDRQENERRHSDQAWMNDRSWMASEPIGRDRSRQHPGHRQGGPLEGGLPGLMARHPLICSTIVMALGGLCFLIFSLVYL